ncbi:hypothetical protein WMY93_010942 [Mugilogobius chulae]|uniref:Uncharacterized protein n=1 Tax=Mugilogobius chulae TaxID=88201 RepID=A0AAW0P8V8_9GOBI
MPISKAFSFSLEKEEGKAGVVQKKLYGEGSNKSSEVPSNIVCNQKTFLPQPATKQNMFPIKPPSLLSRFKPGSLLPKRHDLPTSGHPMKTNNAQVLQQMTEMPRSYNLRSTAAGASALKQPVSGIRKPAASNIASGIQRAGHGLKPPQAKSTSVPSTSDKPVAGYKPVAKAALPAKRHHLPKTDAVPAAKKKKIDNPLPSSDVELVASSDMAKAKNLRPPSHSQRTLPAKPPKHDAAIPPFDCDPVSRVLRPQATSLKSPVNKPQCHGCANCSSLEEQLKLKDEEIKQLKEEILKLNKKEDSAP